jgi:hypothetical protein
MSDLVVICPDQNWKAVLEAVLSRHESLKIREIDFMVLHNPLGSDGGTRVHGARFVRTQRSRFSHALVVFDRQGCGSSQPEETIEQEVEVDLQRDWQEHGRAVVVEPELEMWLIGAHYHFREIPKLAGVNAREWFSKKGLWPNGAKKPDAPKEHIEELFRAHRMTRSSANYRKIASTASLMPERCRCRSFGRFVGILRGWTRQPSGVCHFFPLYTVFQVLESS